MELVERYLQAVSFWLPTKQKHDIIAELSEDIYTQIEEQETTLARKLSEAEVGAILKQRGRPLLVANRYSPQESLIGPLLFPIYRFVMKIVFCYLGAWVLVWLGLVIFQPSFRTAHSVSAASSSLWFSAFAAVTAVTLAFACIEQVQRARPHFLEDWNPRKLPPIRSSNLIPRPSSSFELAIGLLFIVWWSAHMSSPTVAIYQAFRLELSPTWPYLFWGFLCVGVINMGLAAVNLVLPYWTGLRAIIRLLSDFAGAALFCWMLKANVVTGMVIATVPPERALQITDAINLWMGRMLPAGLIITVIVVVLDALRIARLREQRYSAPRPSINPAWGR